MSLFGSLIKTALAKGASNVADSATPSLTQRVRAQLGGVVDKFKSTPSPTPEPKPISIPKTFVNETPAPSPVSDIDDLGFYSPIERLATKLAPKGTGEQYFGILAKGDGQGSRIREEMEDMGLDSWLLDKGKVNRDEVLNFIDENKLRYQNTTLNKKPLKKFEPGETEGDYYYKDYSLLGGKNYQENLMTLPSLAKTNPDLNPSFLSVRNENISQEGSYYSPHYEELGKNLAVTTRSQEFTTSFPPNKTVSVMEELQSDLHKVGKDEGYRESLSKEKNELLDELMFDERYDSYTNRVANDFKELNGPNSFPEEDGALYKPYYYETSERIDVDKLFNEGLLTATEAKERKAIYKKILEDPKNKDKIEELETLGKRLDKRDVAVAKIMGDYLEFGGVPDAPAKKSWMNQGIKIELARAIDTNKDYFAWTGGADQADRYGLRTPVKKVYYKKTGKDPKYKSFSLELYGADNQAIKEVNSRPFNYARYNMNEKDITSLLGKKVAKKIVDDEGVEVERAYRGFQKVLEVDDMEAGAVHGMKAFYDKDVKKRVETIIKKLDPNAKVEIITLNTRESTPDGEGIKVWGVKITDKMKNKPKGMSLYSIAGGGSALAASTNAALKSSDTKSKEPDAI